MRYEVIVIGASTGGPKAISTILSELPEKVGVPILIVQHMPKNITKTFADRLNTICKLNVVEAKHGMIIEKNKVYIAPGGYHMRIVGRTISLNTEKLVWGVRPAVDILFFSASQEYGKKVLAILLTGMGRDGSDGMKMIRDNGGTTIAQDENTCVIYGMPKAAFERGVVDTVLPLYDIGKDIISKTCENVGGINGYRTV